VSCAAHPHASLDPSEQLPVPMPPHGGTWTRVYLCVYVCVWCVCFSASICVRVMLQHILTQALIHQSSYPCQCHLMVVPGLVYICVCMCVYGVCDFQLQYVCVSCAAHPHASLGPSQQGPVPTQAHVHPLIYAHTDTHLTTWSSVTASMCAK